MSKFYSLLAIVSLLMLRAPAFAADSGSSATDTAKVDAGTTSESKGGKHDHEHIAGRRNVLGISSLSAKQKEQINAVYDANKSKFDDLQKQLHELKEDEWSKIRPILTAEQLAELKNSPKGHGGHHHSHTRKTESSPAAPEPAKSGTESSK